MPRRRLPDQLNSINPPQPLPLWSKLDVLVTERGWIPSDQWEAVLIEGDSNPGWKYALWEAAGNYRAQLSRNLHASVAATRLLLERVLEGDEIAIERLADKHGSARLSIDHVTYDLVRPLALEAFLDDQMPRSKLWSTVRERLNALSGERRTGSKEALRTYCLTIGTIYLVANGHSPHVRPVGLVRTHRREFTVAVLEATVEALWDFDIQPRLPDNKLHPERWDELLDP